MPSNHLILWGCFFLLPSIFPSIRVFSNELALHIRWPKYCSFSISPSNEYSGLISFRIDWFDLLAVQGTLKSFLHHHSSKASVLRCSVFFIVQLSHPYMTTGKTIPFSQSFYFEGLETSRVKVEITLSYSYSLSKLRETRAYFSKMTGIKNCIKSTRVWFMVKI